MSRAEEKGWEAAIDNNGAPMKPEWWENEAFAYGYIRGIESLLDNLDDTPDADISEWTTREAEEERHRKAIKETQDLIDQVTGTLDHKNQIQRMAREIENLKDRIKQLEESR